MRVFQWAQMRMPRRSEILWRFGQTDDLPPCTGKIRGVLDQLYRVRAGAEFSELISLEAENKDPIWTLLATDATPEQIIRCMGYSFDKTEPSAPILMASPLFTIDFGGSTEFADAERFARFARSGTNTRLRLDLRGYSRLAMRLRAKQFGAISAAPTRTTNKRLR